MSNLLSLVNQMIDYGYLNVVSVFLAFVFLLPVWSGYRSRNSLEMTSWSLHRIFNTLEFIAALIATVYIARNVPESFRIWLNENIKRLLPSESGRFDEQYLQLTQFLLSIVLYFSTAAIISFISGLVKNRVVVFMAKKLYGGYSTSRNFAKGITAVLLRTPTAGWNTFVWALLLTLYSGIFPANFINSQMDRSEFYQAVYKYSISPAIHSEFTRKLPVLVNDSLGSIGLINPTKEVSLPQIFEVDDKSGKIKVIRYFNGVTLEEAIKSNNEIDSAAEKIAGGENDARKRAKLLYKWVGSNVRYDYEKAAAITEDSSKYNSGAIEAFNTRRGICFDYASLYVAMCRAEGLQVRMMVGMANSGLAWGPHAWNQVYIPGEDIWINVDTTFASGGNYFDNTGFENTHTQSQVAGEW